MKIKIVMYTGEEQVIECDAFEFRCNQVTNWIRYKKDGNDTFIHRVATINCESRN